MTYVAVLQYNFLNEYLPQYDDLPKRLLRSAVIGFSASAISDTCSNSIRVVKTSKQTATTPITYPEVVKARHLLGDWLCTCTALLHSKLKEQVVLLYVSVRQLFWLLWLYEGCILLHVLVCKVLGHLTNASFSKLHSTCSHNTMC